MHDETPKKRQTAFQYVPEVPLRPAPYWRWPVAPWSIVLFLWRNFLQFSDRAMFLFLAIFIGFVAQPFGPHEAQLEFGWIGWIYLRNLICLSVVAGGLHIWFYGIDGQGNLMRYDTRDTHKKKSQLFKFGYQLWDNMFFSLVYAVPIATFWEVLIRYAAARDWLSMMTFDGGVVSWIWLLALFPLMTIWQSAHFYLMHRVLHYPFLYRHVHAIHHRNTNPGPWSGLSMHPVEHLFYFSTLLIFFLLPAHPSHVIFLLFWGLLGAPSGHSGYEAVFAWDRKALSLNCFFHHLHHRYFDCNYGSGEFPFDHWFGTYHDGTEKGDEMLRARRRFLNKTSG